jgi:UDPglucose 6-dehydrogenase
VVEITRRTVMKIGVIGGGVTGSATAAAFRGHCDEVRVFDTEPCRRTHSGDAVLDCDVIFICLPEAAVDQQFSYLGTCEHRHRNIVLRSTVPVGTTRRLAERYGLPNLVHSPEFLTERTALEDAANPRLCVVGYPGWTIGNVEAHAVSELYRTRWPMRVKVMSSDESELVKLATNAFFATKVSFWNEVESYCRAAGVDYETVRAACVAEGRVGDLHTHVPGPSGGYGFSGKCLPKDLRQLIKCYADVGVPSPLMESVERRNNTIDLPRGL